jgi:hypothetical protein
MTTNWRKLEPQPNMVGKKLLVKVMFNKIAYFYCGRLIEICGHYALKNYDGDIHNIFSNFAFAQNQTEHFYIDIDEIKD